MFMNKKKGYAIFWLLDLNLSTHYLSAFLFSILSFDYKIALDIVDRDRTNIFISTELDKEIQ